MKPEEDIKGFLLLIVNTIAVVLIWMILNVLAGIYFGLAFFDEGPGWKNIIYYIIFIISLVFLIRYIIKKWR